MNDFNVHLGAETSLLPQYEYLGILRRLQPGAAYHLCIGKTIPKVLFDMHVLCLTEDKVPRFR
jgi:hypothetical protein